MVPSAILQSVFLIKYGNSTGTCFLISHDNNNYLITAKHIFPVSIPFDSEVDVSLYRNGGWLPFKPQPRLLYHDNSNIDIAVLEVQKDSSKHMPFDIGSKNYYSSQDCFFVGFPFGLKMDDDATGSLNQGFPLPFVKNGIISMFINDSMKMTQIFLDGHNNPGFSGGPVVIKNLDGQSQNQMRIIGVVSAYLNEDKIIKIPYGDLINSENSGIVLSYSFDHVFEIIIRKEKKN